MRENFIVEQQFLKNSILLKIGNLLNYLDLGYVADNLEDLIILPIPIKYAFMSEECYENNKKMSLKNFDSASKSLELLSAELELRINTFKYIRKKVNPNFGKSYNCNLERNEGCQYLNIKHKFLDALKKIYETSSNNDYSELLLSIKDSISELIDSPSSVSKATYFEDTYILAELDNLPKNIIIPKDMSNNIKKIKSQLEQRIKQSNYNNIKRTSDSIR